METRERELEEMSLSPGRAEEEEDSPEHAPDGDPKRDHGDHEHPGAPEALLALPEGERARLARLLLHSLSPPTLDRVLQEALPWQQRDPLLSLPFYGVTVRRILLLLDNWTLARLPGVCKTWNSLLHPSCILWKHCLKREGVRLYAPLLLAYQASCRPVDALPDAGPIHLPQSMAAGLPVPKAGEGQQHGEDPRTMLATTSSPSPAHLPALRAKVVRYLGKPHLEWRDLWKECVLTRQHWRHNQYLVTQLLGHQAGVYAITGVDAEHVVTASKDMSLKLWNTKTRVCLATLLGHAGSVLCCHYVGGGWLVSGSADQDIHVWALEEGLRSPAPSVVLFPPTTPGPSATNTTSTSTTPVLRARRVLHVHTDAVLGITGSPDGRYVVSCSKDESVCVVELASGALVHRLTGHSASVNAVVLYSISSTPSPEGPGTAADSAHLHIASGGGDRKIKLWHLGTGQLLATLRGHTRGIACLAVHGDVLASGSSDLTIRLWHLRTHASLSVVHAHTDVVRSLHLTPTAVLSASYDGTVVRTDRTTGTQTLLCAHLPRIHRIWPTFSALLIATRDRGIVKHEFAASCLTDFFWHEEVA